MASGALYNLEECYDEKRRAELLRKVSFNDVPAEVLWNILNSDYDTQGVDDLDNYAHLQDDELVELMTVVCKAGDEDESEWWNRTDVNHLTVDQFVRYFVRSKLFRLTVRRLLDPVFTPTKMDVLQLADNGEELLSSVDECDTADDNDILKMRQVNLVKVDKDAPGSTISAKYTASFDFESGEDSVSSRRRSYASTFFNTGLLFTLFASLGELGNTGQTNNTTQNQIRLADSSYEIGVNGDLTTWGSKLRFLKAELVSVIVDIKYLWTCMMEEPDHPFYKECHPNRNNGALQIKSFLKRYAYRFSMRHSTDISEKQMLPKIRYSKVTGKTYMKFTMSVLRKVGAKEKPRKMDDRNNITDATLYQTLQDELEASPQKIYRFFYINLHSLLGRKKLKNDRRSNLGYGDLIRFSVSTTCYCDSQKNIFTVLHSPRGNAEVLLRSMYLQSSEGVEMSRPKVEPRLQQIALKNMMNTEDEEADVDELFCKSETSSFAPRPKLTSGERREIKLLDCNDQGPVAKKIRRSIEHEPFSN